MRRPIWSVVVAVLLVVLGFVGVVVGAIVLNASRSSPSVNTGVAPGTGNVPGSGTGSGGSAQFGGFTSNGERIYHTGVGHSGAISRQWNPPTGFGGGMMGGRGTAGRFAGMGCVTCHRADGRGGRIGMMGTTIDVPDVRYSTLTSPSEATSGTVPGWTETEIADAIRNGVEPGGKRLDPFMPRWDMDATDMKDTIDYLKELSKR